MPLTRHPQREKILRAPGLIVLRREEDRPALVTDLFA